MTVDTKLSYKYKAVTAYIGINNLFDKKYSSAAGLNFLGERRYWPAPERNFYGGLKIAL
jgi:iron complex outermembrane receptor protein